MLYHVTIGTRTFVVELSGSRVVVDGADVGATELAALPGTHVRHLLRDGRSTTVVAQRVDERWHMYVDGWPVTAEVVDERTRALRALTQHAGAATGPRPVRAPMPGLIIRVDVAVGDRVRAGQPVVAMEAMKMENELKADGDGVVARILVEPSQAVEKGAILVELEVIP
ncbi:MAG TPA: acetyl-CoA carboxylase biotin carboxyl carrier protein subunit [Longimicrobiales bacterium]|nr:acetyl-CoA carboxylase biotin carboxyl carrier protein subunit [Longimicrobiales bacterium]